MAWTQTTYGFETVTSTVTISGATAILSGTGPFLRFTDTDSGHEDWRLFVDTDLFSLQWLSGTGPDVWTDVLVFSDPAAAARTLTLTDYALYFTGLDAAQVFLRAIVSTEANPRFRIDTNGKIEWGPGGATAVDTALERTATAILSTATIRGTVAPSNAADLTRKDYVDTADNLRLLLSGGTMTGLLTLSGAPTANLHAATKLYVDGLAFNAAGQTMTGTLTFDFSVAGTIIQSKVASEANPRWQVTSAGIMSWGAGGASAVDISLQRGAANRLDLLDRLRITGDSNIGIDFTTDNNADIGASATANRPRGIFAGTHVAIGTTPADSGHLRLPTAGSITFRNAGNTTNIVVMTTDGSDNLIMRPGSGGAILSHADGGSNLGSGARRWAGIFFNGNLDHDGTAVGFFSATPAAQQTSGANLTNNVTAGGVNDTIADYTDLAVYANDAAAIRNDIYQLARKLKQVNDALRLYGLLT